jgi:hypothetical protein
MNTTSWSSAGEAGENVAGRASQDGLSVGLIERNLVGASAATHGHSSSSARGWALPPCCSLVAGHSRGGFWASLPMVATPVRSIFAQGSDRRGVGQHGRVVDQLEGRLPEAAALLGGRRPRRLGVHFVPPDALAPDLVQQSLERLDKEVRRRTDVVGIFPNRAAITRLVGAVLAERHDEWTVARRYLSVQSLAKRASL